MNKSKTILWLVVALAVVAVASRFAQQEYKKRQQEAARLALVTSLLAPIRLSTMSVRDANRLLSECGKCDDKHSTALIPRFEMLLSAVATERMELIMSTNGVRTPPADAVADYLAASEDYLFAILGAVKQRSVATLGGKEAFEHFKAGDMGAFVSAKSANHQEYEAMDNRAEEFTARAQALLLVARRLDGPYPDESFPTVSDVRPVVRLVRDEYSNYLTEADKQKGATDLRQWTEAIESARNASQETK